MYKKAFLIIMPLVVFLLANACLAAVKPSLQTSQDKVMYLIDTRDFKTAQTVIDKMTTDFKGNKLLGRRLWEDANRFDKLGAFDYAKALSDRVVANYPTDNYAASYASLLSAKLDIYGQIALGDLESADSAVQKMMSDFAGHRQLARRVWEVANRYDKYKAFNYSKQLCDRIVKEFPDDLYATYAAMQSAKLDIYEQIDIGNLKGAGTAVDKLMKDFAGHKQLSRRLYEIAQKYAKSGAKAYAKELHGRIAASWPNDKYGKRSAIQYKKFEVYNRLDANDLQSVGQNISQMKGDFAGSDMLYAQLNSIGEKYDSIGQTETARKMYQEIIDNYPPDGDKAILAETRARLAQYELFSAIESGNDEKVSEIIQGLPGRLYDANDRPDMFMDTIASSCSTYGRRAIAQGNTVVATGYFVASISILERLFTQYPDSPLAGNACFAAGAQSAQELGDYAKAIEYFRKVVDNWPEYEHADWAQLKIGRYLEEMIKNRQLSAAQGQPSIIEAYQKVIDNYPRSNHTAYAEERLASYE